MRESNHDVWIFFLPDARAGRDDPCGGHRYRDGIVYDVLLDDGQASNDQIHPLANTVQGFDWLFERLEGLGAASKQLLVGLEATSRYGENLLQALLKRGYQVCLLHPCTGYLDHPFKTMHRESEKDLLPLLANTGRSVYNQ